MAGIRLDHPILISGEQVRRREFVTSRRGYDPDQVRAYLEQLADQIDLMGSMIREARLEADTASRAASQPQEDPYERLAARIASVIREADQTAERLRVAGRREADRLLAEARSDADRVRSEAQAQAEQARADGERALQEARDQADRTIAGLSTRREAMVDQLAQMQERLLGVARELEEAIEAPSDVDWSMPSAGVVAPTGTPETTSTAADEVIDLRTGDEPPAPPAGDPVAGDVLDDPAYEDLWDGTDSIRIEMPDIPELDLSWEDERGSSSSTS